MQEDTRIRIIAQQFYGNRTGTEIRRENADYFLRGYMGPELDPADIRDMNRRVVRVPGSDNVVIVYDQKQEDNYVAVDFPELYAWHAEEYCKQTGKELTMHVSCEIPELNFRIHTRCFACRMDADGNLQSLEDGDGKLFIQYFPMK